MANKIVVALDNLANAVVEKNGTIETLVKANLALTKAVADRDTSLIALTTAITKFSNQSSKGGGGDCVTTDDPAVFNPMGYCWSRGYTYKHGHSSATCNKKKTGNQVTAKRGGIQGGVTWNQDWKPWRFRLAYVGDISHNVRSNKYVQTNLVNNTFSTSGCSNPSILSNTALVDTGASVSLLEPLHLPTLQRFNFLQKEYSSLQEHVSSSMAPWSCFSASYLRKHMMLTAIQSPPT